MNDQVRQARPLWSAVPTLTHKTDDFESGGSEMRTRIREFDWSKTPLGPIESWPQSLRTTVSLCLASNFPINIIWGPEHTQIYNDGYVEGCGEAHPRALGENYTVTWKSAWPAIGESFERALAGETMYLKDQRMFLKRLNGALEETFFTFSHSPIMDESGGVGGLFHPVTETTPTILAERRTRALRDLNTSLDLALNEEEVAHRASEALLGFEFDVPFFLFYALDAKTRSYRLAAHNGIAGGRPATPASIEFDANAPWPFAAALSAARSLEVDAEPILGGEPCGPYEEPPNRAFVLPVSVPGTERSPAVIVAGVSPRLPISDDYRGFFDLIAMTISGALATVRALEDERRRAEALAEIDRTKTAFFSNVSHEFRTPLTLLLGPLEELLAETSELPSKSRERVEIAHRNSLRLMKLVNTLLNFSRLEAGRVQAKYEPTDLGALTADLASTFRSAIERVGLLLKVDCPPLAEAVYVDREMWEKIVLNLLSNAFKFTFEGEIELSLRQSGKDVELAVRDTGTGIPADELSRVFERFHRVKDARGRSFEGSGIGLALVQELVKLHGGSIRVESEIDRGSRFSVCIPMGSAHLPSNQIATMRPDQPVTHKSSDLVEEALRWIPENSAETKTRMQISRDSLDTNGTISHDALIAASRRPRVLLVDDNTDMREYVERLLRSSFEVIPVADGVAALESARKCSPDLVLTDVMMPRLDGFGLLRELRADVRTREVPVILLSARAAEESRIEGFDSGADDYLVKPFSAKELLARIEGCLKLQRLRREARRDLEQSEKKFRAFVTASSDVVYRMSADWSEMRHLEGKGFIPNTENPSRDWLEKYIHADDREHVAAEFNKAIQTRNVFELEHRVVRTDGTLGWISSRAVPLLDANGETVEWFGAANDVTPRKEAEEALRTANLELQRVNRELEEFAYVASHDLQEPLRMVNSYSQLLIKRLGNISPQDAQMYVDFINTGVRRMERLIQDLLSFARTVQSEKPSAVPVDLKTSLDQALEILRPRIESTKAQIEVGEMPVVMADETQLSLLFQNLLSNGLKYAKQDVSPCIQIAATRHGREWTISVRDNGIGFRQEYAEHIFGLFKRLHRSEYPGTGLGLAICKRVVERYGGRIWVESAPGEGSTFSFAFVGAEQ